MTENAPGCIMTQLELCRRMRKGKVIITIVSVVLILLAAVVLSLLVIIRTDCAFLVNRIIDMKRGEDSPWDFSFGKIAEKDGEILFRGFSLSYEENLLCYIEEGSLDLSLSALYSFWKNGDSSVSAVVEGGSVDLTMILASYADYETRDKKGTFSFYDFITRRNVSVKAGGIHVDYDYFSSTLENIILEYTSQDEVFSGSFNTSVIDASLSGWTGKVRGAAFSFIRDGNITLRAVLDKITVEGEGIEGEFNSVTFEEETASVSAFLKNDYTGTLALSSATLSREGIDITLNDGTFSYSDNLVSGSFRKADADGMGAVMTADNVSLSCGTDSSYMISCESMNVSYSSNNTCITNASVRGRLGEDNASVIAQSLYSDYSDMTAGKIGMVRAGNLSAEVTNAEGYTVSLSGEVEAETKGESLEDITFSFTADAAIDETGNTSGRVEIDNLYPGFGTTLTSPLIIEAGDDGVTASIESDTVRADISYEREGNEITGNVMLDDLPVKTALEFLLEREFEKLSGKSVIDMTSDFVLSYEEEFTGTASFDITLSAYRISFFTFAVGINGGVELADGKMVLDGVRFTSSILSFGIEGYYDLVTGRPHFSFTK